MLLTSETSDTTSSVYEIIGLNSIGKITYNLYFLIILNN